VPAAGGSAQRLTAYEGEEKFPHISPDGRLIAFTAQYDGNDDVYVISADGGEPARLTYHPAQDIVIGWTADGGEWTFDQGVDYFMKEGGLDRESATGEAAGAAATPGQKIHYTLGKWQIERLLGRARDAKGEAFSLRAFHDELLSQGSIPLSLAEWAMLGDDSGYREAVRLGEAGD